MRGLKEAKQSGDPKRQPYFRKTEKQLIEEMKNEQQVSFLKGIIQIF
jgi:2-keto-3-deoxy-galactonokinase